MSTQSPSGSIEIQVFRIFSPVITTVRVYLNLSEITPLRHISVLLCSGIYRDLAPVADKVAAPDINYELLKNPIFLFSV